MFPVKKAAAFIFLAFFAQFPAFSQSSLASLKGKVLDSEQSELIMANLELLSAIDSSLAKAGLTDSEGKFDLSGLKPGKYHLKITYVGMSDYRSPEIELLAGEDKFLDPIVVNPAANELDAVEITAQKPLVTVKPDMTVFHVQNSTIGIGTNAFDLLRKAPGVAIDNNDNVMLQGKSGVRIYIDGKPSPLSASDLSGYLQTIQSSQIDVIEIITNPSARFEAEGNAGIINIVMKRDKNFGTSVNASVGYAIGIFSKYDGSFGINYRNKKVGAFGSYSMGAGNKRWWMQGYREQLNLGFESDTYTLSNPVDHNFRTGADYFFGKHHTIGFIASGNTSEGNRDTYSTSYMTDLSTGQMYSVLISESINPGTRNNVNGNLNYRFDNTKGWKLNIDADYGIFRISTITYQPNYYMDPTETVIQSQAIYRMEAPTEISIATFKLDYEMPLWKGSLGAGGKFSTVMTANTYNFYDEVNGTDTLNLDRTNHFEYTENVNAGYMTYNRKIDKWAFNAGLRVEQTNSLGDLTSAKPTTDDQVERHYLNLFPSGGLTYAFNQNNSFRLNYSRRIDRPKYQNLNPFEWKINELSYMRGNPFLQPQYTHSFEFTHTYKYTLNTSVSYSLTSDFFTEITDTTETNRTYLTTLNLATRDVWNLNMSYPWSPKDWWSTFTNAGLTQLRNRADFGPGKEIDITALTFNIYHQQTFKLPSDFNLEVSGFYRSPGIWGANFRNKSMAGLDFGVIRKFLEGRGSIKMSVTDIFRTMWWRGIQAYGGLFVDVSGGWESRTFKVNLTYLFGNNQMKGVKKRKTGMEEEGSRVEAGQ